MTPSDFNPAWTVTQSESISMTVPVTIAPGVISISVKLCSNNSAKLSLISIPVNLRLNRTPAHTGLLPEDSAPTFAGEVGNGAGQSGARCLQTLTHQFENLCHHLFYVRCCGIHDDRVLGRTQRRRAAVGIPLVTRLNIHKKGGEININPLINQLLIAAFCTLFGRGGQEDFSRGIRKYDGTHVPAIGHQPRRLTELPLQFQ